MGSQARKFSPSIMKLFIPIRRKHTVVTNVTNHPSFIVVCKGTKEPFIDKCATNVTNVTNLIPIIQLYVVISKMYMKVSSKIAVNATYIF